MSSNHFGTSFGAIIKRETGSIVRSLHSLRLLRMRLRRLPKSHRRMLVSRKFASGRRTKISRDASGVRAKFGVDPELIADYLALIGDASDGYPGIKGIGAKGAAALLTRYGKIELFPQNVLGENHGREAFRERR